jgi:hypothetical protein
MIGKGYADLRDLSLRGKPESGSFGLSTASDLKVSPASDMI